ncbi:hypothetical protein [Nostoc sp. 'Lobaria pulmonaria (5183) cyanobiont']|uniref:hypothetical protein n=1 Tax=Nostoc sp. 'Lobaria pulmonaria (5183) cyanobiont' TaxID=1618022 RepID=UPI001F31D277|nr:hypothetical protein [Nostoc sp. 'Lobaria pulmonaria (5183) cyanobiont']
MDLYRGDITVEEYKNLVLEAAKAAGIATPIVFLILVAVLALSRWALKNTNRLINVNSLKAYIQSVYGALHKFTWFGLIVPTYLFPEFTVILSAPVVVAGFNSLFGISIAMPIIQSLLRHAQAGGFGAETAEAYRNALGGSTPA